MLPVWLSVGLHAALLGGGWFLVSEAGSPAPKPLSLARVEIIEPRAEEIVTPEDVIEPDHGPVDATADPLEMLEPLESRLDDLVIPEDESVPLSQPVDVHDLPLEVVKIRVRRKTPIAVAPQPPVARPAPPVVRAPAQPRRGRPLRVISRPDVMRYYPAEAQRRGIEGTAVVEIRVDRRGVVVSAKIVRSSSSELLDRQALRVMYDHRFAAGDGGRARVPVAFSLR